ncbi:MAG: argininosuccinate lyase [Nitrosopumilaceae archaeon]
MYRSRLDKNLDAHTLEYLSSVSEDSEIAQYDILGSQAHAIMLFENKIITKKEATKILSALEKLKKQNFLQKTEHEDIHELIESLVVKSTGSRVGGKMHTARSRNDQISLDIRMKIRDDINTLCSHLLELIDTLVSVAEKNQKTMMPLYTHLQHAQVGVFSHYLLAYVDALFRDIDRLYVTYGRVNESPLGAGPIGGTSLRIDRHSTAKMLGFKGLVENTIDATGSRDFVAEYVGTVAILMTNLSRIAGDFILWSSSEFSFIELSDQFASPSSVMPQKKNPDILELIRGKTAQIIGYQTSILSTVKGLASGYSRDLQQIKIAIWPTSAIAISTLVVLNSVLKTMKVNKQKMKKATDSGHLIALDVAEHLVKRGIPFRTAHKVVGGLVQVAHNSKRPLSKLTVSEIRKSTKESQVNAKDLHKIIQSTSLESSLHERTSLGSSGIAEQKRMISDREKKILAYQGGVKKRSNEVKSALQHLTKKVKAIVK